MLTLQMADEESTSNYFLKAEKFWTAQKNAGEPKSDGLIVAMRLETAWFIETIQGICDLKW